MGNNKIAVIDTATNTVITTVTVGNGPRNIAIGPGNGCTPLSGDLNGDCQVTIDEVQKVINAFLGINQ